MTPEQLLKYKKLGFLNADRREKACKKVYIWYIMGISMFEFDEDKSKANKQKHGIDFVEAQQLWKDDKRIEVPAKSETEERFAAIGLINDAVWTAFYTQRNENIRIISVRRARENEKEAYFNG